MQDPTTLALIDELLKRTTRLEEALQAALRRIEDLERQAGTHEEHRSPGHSD